MYSEILKSILLEMLKEFCGIDYKYSEVELDGSVLSFKLSVGSTQQDYKVDFGGQNSLQLKQNRMDLAFQHFNGKLKDKRLVSDVSTNTAYNSSWDERVSKPKTVIINDDY